MASSTNFGIPYPYASTSYSIAQQHSQNHQLQQIQPQAQIKRERTKYNEFQLKYLENVFHKQKYPQTAYREEIAKFLQLTDTKVQVWFKNRRAKEKQNEKLKNIQNSVVLARSSAEYSSFNQQQSQQTVDELQQECKPKYSKIIKSDEDPKQNEPDEAEDEEVGSKQQTSSAYKLSDDNGEGKHIPVHNMIYTNEIKPVESISNEWSRQQYQQKFPFAPTVNHPRTSWPIHQFYHNGYDYPYVPCASSAGGTLAAYNPGISPFSFYNFCHSYNVENVSALEKYDKTKSNLN